MNLHVLFEAMRRLSQDYANDGDFCYEDNPNGDIEFARDLTIVLPELPNLIDAMKSTMWQAHSGPFMDFGLQEIRATKERLYHGRYADTPEIADARSRDRRATAAS